MADAPAYCEPEEMDAEDVLYILYTSGTTGKPKGIVHTTGGYLTGVTATTKLVFDLRDDDVFWCTADVGWVTGHSYLVYGPLANGATCVMYEGAPDWPEKDRFWEHLRAARRDDPVHRADRDSRVHEMGRRVPGAARPQPAALVRQRRRADQSRSVDVVSRAHRRQSLPDRRHVVADRDRRDRHLAASGRHRDEARQRDDARCPDTPPTLLDAQGEPRFRWAADCSRITRPWPSMLRTIWGDDERYVQTYFSKWPGRPTSTSPATAPSATTTATSGSSAASTTC